MKYTRESIIRRHDDNKEIAVVAFRSAPLIQRDVLVSGTIADLERTVFNFTKRNST